LLDSREGQWVYYQINPELPAWAIEILDVVTKQFVLNPVQQQDSARLQIMGGRPEQTKYCC
jgi:ArsR family transcriptional regulator